MRGLAAIAGALALCIPAAVAGAPLPPAAADTPGIVAAPATTWAATQIAMVVAAGAMGPDVATFRPTDPLTRGELYDALTALGKPVPLPADPSRPVTMRELDARLVASLGLLPAARRFRITARDAGLTPTAMLGTETVARLLGLRINHPADQDDLELLPSQAATRAEAAYSLSRVMGLTPGQVTWVDGLSQTFVLPALSDWQRTVVSRALRFVGYPYVWAGMSEKPQQRWSATAAGGFVSVPGGFDCSGFVWRVYKTQPFAGAPLLAGILKGRTTYSMSAEVTKAQRIALADLQPGDVLFFGAHGTLSTPQEIDHAGIYLGGGWLVQSSSTGVALAPLQGWYSTRFAWARRPLAEAGLTA